MRRRSWMVFVGVLVTACGGSRPSPQEGETGPDTGTGSDTGADAGLYYSDVKGFDVPSGAEKVAIGQWPSWLHEKELVAACAEGDVFYADRCWYSMVIDVDARTVTFSDTSGGTETLALGAPIPGALGSMVLQKESPDEGNGVVAYYYPHHMNTGYVMMAGPWVASVGWTAGDVWESPIAPHDYDRPLVRSPWVVGSQIQVQAGNVFAFLVRTTFLYGFRTTGKVDTQAFYEAVHNWSYRGHVRVNGQDLSFPLHLADVAKATGASTTTPTSYDGRYIDLEDHTIRLVSEDNVMETRAEYGGESVGLTDSDLVTSIEFHEVKIIGL